MEIQTQSFEWEKSHQRRTKSEWEKSHQRRLLATSEWGKSSCMWIGWLEPVRWTILVGCITFVGCIMSTRCIALVGWIAIVRSIKQHFIHNWEWNTWNWNQKKIRLVCLESCGQSIALYRVIKYCDWEGYGCGCMKDALGVRTYSLRRPCWMRSSRYFRRPNSGWFGAF